jgi:hypothetical protein
MDGKPVQNERTERLAIPAGGIPGRFALER